MDVCPFIPVKNVTMDDCVECAQELGERLAAELGIPGKIIELWVPGK
jgi:glutamate formiminotransferase/formiminotetrahydrofolate cyclodeaminase